MEIQTHRAALLSWEAGEAFLSRQALVGKHTQTERDVTILSTGPGPDPEQPSDLPLKEHSAF